MDRWLFIRVYAVVFVSLYILMIHKYEYMVKTFFITNLWTIPISIVLVTFLSIMSRGSISFLYGGNRQEKNTEAVREAEIDKGMPLLEQKKYRELLKVLDTVEEEYGLSSRLIYYRAKCLVEMGKYRKAEQCLADYLRTNRTDTGSD